MSGCLALWGFKLADHVCSWLSSLWVVTVPCYISSLLNITVIIFFRMWVVAALSCIFTLLTMPFFDLSESDFLLCLSVFQVCWQCLFFPLQQVSDWHACCISNLPIMLALLCLAGEWLSCLAAFQACWQCLSGIFRKWVASCIAVFHSCWEHIFLALHWSLLSIAYQHVCTYSPLKSTNNIYVWFFSLWVLFICSLKLISHCSIRQCI